MVKRKEDSIRVKRIIVATLLILLMGVALWFHQIDQKKISVLANRIEMLSQEKETLEDKQAKLNDEAEKMEKALGEKDITIDGFEKTNDVLESENVELQKKRDELQAEIDRLLLSSVSESNVENVENETDSYYDEETNQTSEITTDGNWTTMTVSATAYSTNEAGLSAYTATGINLHENPQVVSVDPNIIPLGSTVVIDGFGTFIAGDTGGAIVGNKIDIHMTDLSACYAFGRQSVQIRVQLPQ